MAEEDDSLAIPKATVSRLVLYLRELQQLMRSGIAHVRSGTLADRLGLTDSQVRRDISHIGQFGRRGVGYPTRELAREIRLVLGTDRRWRVILVGMGNLGQALSGYRGFKEQGFDLCAVFDSDPTKIGHTIHGHEIHSMDRLDEYITQHGQVDLAIMAVPASSAPNIAARLNSLGITGILNFAPVSVKRHAGDAAILDVDLAVELQRLAFAVVRNGS